MKATKTKARAQSTQAKTKVVILPVGTLIHDKSAGNGGVVVGAYRGATYALHIYLRHDGEVDVCFPDDLEVAEGSAGGLPAVIDSHGVDPLAIFRTAGLKYGMPEGVFTDCGIEHKHATPYNAAAKLVERMGNSVRIPIEKLQAFIADNGHRAIKGNISRGRKRKMPWHQCEIIKQANADGYSPTPAQAQRISRLSCQLYQMKGGGNPINEALMKKCDKDSIEQVMQGDADKNPKHVHLA